MKPLQQLVVLFGLQKSYVRVTIKHNYKKKYLFSSEILFEDLLYVLYGVIKQGFVDVLSSKFLLYPLTQAKRQEHLPRYIFKIKLRSSQTMRYMYLARSAFAQKLLLNLSPHVQHGRALVFSGAKFHNRFLSFSIVQKESCLLYKWETQKRRFSSAWTLTKNSRKWCRPTWIRCYFNHHLLGINLE